MRFSITLSLALVATIVSVQALPRGDISSSVNVARLEKRFGDLPFEEGPDPDCEFCDDTDRGDRGDRGDRFEDGHGINRVVGDDGPHERLGDDAGDRAEDGPGDAVRDRLTSRLEEDVLASKAPRLDKEKAHEA